MKRLIAAILLTFAMVFTFAPSSQAALNYVTNTDCYDVGITDNDCIHLRTFWKLDPDGTGIIVQQISIWMDDCSQYNTPNSMHIGTVRVWNQNNLLMRGESNLDEPCEVDWIGMGLEINAANCVNVYANNIDIHVKNWGDSNQSLHNKICVVG